MWGSVCVFLYLGGCTIILIINSVFCRCTHLWNLRQDSCCWVYSRVGKVHQLPSRLPEIFHSKLLSSKEHGCKYRQTKVVGLFSPETKGTLNCHFASVLGATWGCWELLEGENSGLGIVIASALKISFSHKRKLPQTWCPSVSKCMSVPAAAPVLCTPSMGKLPQGSFGGKKKPSSGLRFFLQALQILNRESCKRL